MQWVFFVLRIAYFQVSSALYYPCRNRHRGCAVQLPPAQLSAHEERECAYRDAVCPVQSCSWRGEPAAAAAHARAAHARLTPILQLGRPVIMGMTVPTSSGQRVSRVLRMVDPERVFFVHLQFNNRCTLHLTARDSLPLHVFHLYLTKRSSRQQNRT